ncbi:DNA-directed RNA pol I, largest subunit [Parasponia andersonii]|uniref:DNA-directed RNA polymerase subunit n=1 Tax=Parasponia andersonii TaxID=3476 RepID=A0A2P5CAS2_PARAD|nr:DNA-directed RNA pol I, largest subunit [Parasponia andersonii]
MATAEVATETVEAVQFSFYTDEEVRKQSFVKITNPNLLDNVERPIDGGLYDPALGPLDERTLCNSCGQRSFNCPGHCGHFDLVSPVYNPLLFNILYDHLQRTCFFCYHFRAGEKEIEKCISQLELILKGDVVGAKELDSESPGQPSDSGDYVGTKYAGAKHLKQQKWTSFEFTEAMSGGGGERLEWASKVYEDALLEPYQDSDIRYNVNKGKKLKWPFIDGEPLPEEEIIHDSPSQDDDSDTGTQSTSTKRHRSEVQNAPEDVKQRKAFTGPLLPQEVKAIIMLLWKNEAKLFRLISDIQCQGSGKNADHSMFFLETILVPPIKFRPPSKGGDSVMEHPQTVLLSKVLQANIDLGNAHVNKLEYSKIVRKWMDLQQSINVMFDSKTAAGKRNVAPGICQLLEKKEGLFRQKMMGKRVNFACRSVISPDPYLAVNEIGIPPYFALRLTYPERVTPWNVVKLRDAIINGPEIHPGATHYVDKLSTVKLAPSRKSRISISRKLPSSRGAITQNGECFDYESEGKFVHRHLQDGDIVLVNRQNLKLPKTSEYAYTSQAQYNGTCSPCVEGRENNSHALCKLQDHIVSAVVLTKKDTFLCWDEFNQLLYSTGLSTPSSSASSRNFGDFEAEIQSLLPAIWKPEPLWTGKQVITALLNHITRGFLPFTVEKGGKIPRDFFNSKIIEDPNGKEEVDEDTEPSKRRKSDHTESKKTKESTKERKADQDELKTKDELDEDKLFIYRNNFVRGVIDKAQFGDYGLVHIVHELYGSNTAGLLLSALSRLFTVFLQMHGFTCGVDDLLLVESKDTERKRLLEKCEEIGEEVHRGFVGVKDYEKIDPFTLQDKIERTVRINGEAALASLDRKMISQLNDITSKSEELKGLLSDGLLKPPSKNCISLMTTSGAKGGAVNFQQISSHLGQQELEGKRVPRMVSGKTLPCFPPWDWASRAGGLIVDRFLSGLRPQEFYFHCMAGREGLVDTAVKTSRSGYLQRCLIKNLEGLKVSYDHTVRDADGSIVQFHYGEDGVDVHQTSFLANFEALAVNKETIFKKYFRQIDKSNPYIKDLPSVLKKKAVKLVNKLSLEQNHNISSQGDFLKLMEHKYLSSLAQPGEPVGVLAAQSVGEPSTQMTLNTFHLAGRGEMNVTLGIPRLQEILMTASKDIKTPVMTCPLQDGRSEEDAARLADRLKKITVADNIESMTVTYEPFSRLENNSICRIFKLEIKLCGPPDYPGIDLEDWKDTLRVDFVRALEDEIDLHIKLLKKMRGISDAHPDPQSPGPNEGDEEFSSNRSQREEEDADDGEDDGENGEVSDDLGLDAQKRKRQVTDEMDYEDDSGGEVNEEDPSAGSESENDNGNNEVEFSKDDEIGILEAKDGPPESPSGVGKLSKSQSTKEKTKSRAESKRTRKILNQKDNDRRLFLDADQFNLKIHFKIDEAHILLGQIAQKVAKKVQFESSGKFDHCQQITCKENQVIYYGKSIRSREDIPPQERDKIPALQATGVDFNTFWELQEFLDVRYVYSNNIHAMLSTYGVEAARETIIREITNVFKSYGISVNIRHLTLIADFMTHTGGYRPMNRLGGIADSVSPFSKMSFETASKFIVQAAYHREIDDLETPSARICLGLPVKGGTGCFDLMQKVEV